MLSIHVTSPLANVQQHLVGNIAPIGTVPINTPHPVNGLSCGHQHNAHCTNIYHQKDSQLHQLFLMGRLVVAFKSSETFTASIWLSNRCLSNCKCFH